MLMPHLALRLCFVNFAQSLLRLVAWPAALQSLHGPVFAFLLAGAPVVAFRFALSTSFGASAETNWTRAGFTTVKQFASTSEKQYWWAPTTPLLLPLGVVSSRPMHGRFLVACGPTWLRLWYKKLSRELYGRGGGAAIHSSTDIE